MIPEMCSKLPTLEFYAPPPPCQSKCLPYRRESSLIFFTTFFHAFSESAVDVEHYIHDKSIRRRLILLSLSNSKFGMSRLPCYAMYAHNIIISIFA